VTNGRRIYSDEPLPDEWVKANIDKGFLNVLMLNAQSTKFLWIPVGNARPNQKYPYKYNPSYPQIHFQQGKLHTCASSSFASCLYFLGLEETATLVNEFGKEYIKNPDNDQSRIIKHIILQVEHVREFTSKWRVCVLNPQLFDIWNIEPERRKHPMLLQVLGSDGGVGHAVTIYDGLIFDSNLKYGVELNEENLQFCLDAVYMSILFGFVLTPQQKHVSKSLKRRRNKRKKLALERASKKQIS
jgi:hypothetical protein